MIHHLVNLLDTHTHMYIYIYTYVYIYICICFTGHLYKQMQDNDPELGRKGADMFRLKSS